MGQEIPLPLPGMEGALIVHIEMGWVVRLQFFLSQKSIIWHLSYYNQAGTGDVKPVGIRTRASSEARPFIA